MRADALSLQQRAALLFSTRLPSQAIHWSPKRALTRQPSSNSTAQKALAVLVIHVTAISLKMPGRRRDWLRNLKFPTPNTSQHTPKAASSAPSGSSLNEAATPSATTPTPSTQHHIALTESPGGVIGDAISESNPTNQPGPISATAATHPQAVGANSIQAQSLWSRAINSNELSKQRKTPEDIGVGADSRVTVSAVKSKMDEILKAKGEQWKVKFKGEEVVLRDVGIKILHWVDRFKQVGDTIVQYDPAHAALPWAGFRFLLQVGLNRGILLCSLTKLCRCA